MSHVCVDKQTFKMAGVTLVFGGAKVLKSSWEEILLKYKETGGLILGLNSNINISRL